MTPYEIDVLLHYFCRGIDHPDIERNPPIWRPTIQRFINANLLRAGHERDQPLVAYVLTGRGMAYCEALQLVPLPAAAWIIRWPSDDGVSGWSVWVDTSRRGQDKA